MKPILVVFVLCLCSITYGFHSSSDKPWENRPQTFSARKHRLLTHDITPTTYHLMSRSTATTTIVTSPITCLRMAPTLPDFSSSGSVPPIGPQLLAFFLETIIANGVPALFSVLVIGFAALIFQRGRKMRGSGSGYDMDDEVFDNPNSPVATLYNDLYGDQEERGRTGGGGLAKLLLNNARWSNKKRDGESLPTNVGVPRAQYLRLHHVNQQYDSYAFSVTAATQSKAAAAAQYRQLALQRALTKSFWDLTLPEWQELQEAERNLLKHSAVVYEQWQEASKQLATTKLDTFLEEIGLDSVYQIDPTPTSNSSLQKSSNNTSSTTTNASFAATGCLEMKKSALLSKKKGKLAINKMESRVQRLEKQLNQLEWDFVSDVLHIVGPKHAASVRTALLGDVATRGLVPGRLIVELQQRPLTAILGDSESETLTTHSLSTRKPILYVCRFPGDATASQVAFLREEVTAIVRQAKKGDEALVILQTGGGTVTGYGLAASQLVRLKSKLKLTVAVEQVAASGGYMMCCVADRIVASPFAVLGSIGVISDIPNVYERLKQEGIEFQTVTAGKYKRTLTPTKKVTKEDFEKTKADVEEILVQFQNFVATNRPQLDIDAVATGETWFGKDALERKLCDEIKPVDDVITEYIDEGFNVYEVEYSPPEDGTSPVSQLLPFNSMKSPSRGVGRGWLRNSVRWLIQSVATEIEAELKLKSMSTEHKIENQFMIQNDDADQMLSQLIAQEHKYR